MKAPLHIFITGGTGSIGSAVMTQALTAGHHVTALARNETSAAKIVELGGTPLHGDIAQPDLWMAQATQADVFIHLASSFDDAMVQTEHRLLTSLITHAQARPEPLRLLYTGGCWLYGQTASAVASEATPFTPIKAIEWAVDAITQLENAANISCAILHPAMVYDHEQGGVFDRALTALRAGRPVPIFGSQYTRWPLVHRDDVAAAYVLLAQDPTSIGGFNIVTEQGVTTGEIARVLSAQAGIKTPPAVLPRKWALMRHGIWAEGPMLDQQMRSTRMAALGWKPQYIDFSNLTYRF